MKKELVVIPKTTLDIYNYHEDGMNVYEFDARECSAPEPMVNSIVVLEILKSKTDRLKVYYFHKPSPLLEKISQNFLYETIELENGDYLITFSRKNPLL